MKKSVTAIALLLWASQAWAQQSTQAGGTGCSTPATAARLGVMSPTIGTVCTITDGASTTDCTTGGGSDKVTCFYCGAAWQSSSCGGASGTYVSKTGDTMSGVLNIDTTVANALQVYADTGTNANYAQMGCAGNGQNSFCNMTLTADNANGSETIIAMLRHQLVDPDVNSIDGKVEILVKSDGDIRSLQHWLSADDGTKTVLVNPSSLDVDFRVYGLASSNIFACDGATKVCSFLNPPTGLSATTVANWKSGEPEGGAGGSTNDFESTTTVECAKFYMSGRMAEIDNVDFVVSTGQGTDTVEFGVFSNDGGTKYFECTLPQNITNDSNVNCSNDLVTKPAMDAGNFWACFSMDATNIVFRSTGSRGTERCEFTTQSATSGEMPDSLSAPSCTWASTQFPYFGLQDR